MVTCCLKKSVVLQDSLHGFREGQGEGTATLETKLSQQLVVITHYNLFQVLLDVRKAYE